jgi:hypothetical protein
MTCALRVTSLHVDTAGDAHADAVFREFKRHHNPKTFRVHDLTGPKEENATWYCVIGDDHFNKDNVKCPEWIPAINGITPSEALNLHMNKPVQKNWYEKPFGLISVGVFIGLLVAYGTYWFGWTGQRDSLQQPPSLPQIQPQTPAASGQPLPHHPKKIRSQVPQKTVSMQTNTKP